MDILVALFRWRQLENFVLFNTFVVVVLLNLLIPCYSRIYWVVHLQILYK